MATLSFHRLLHKTIRAVLGVLGLLRHWDPRKPVQEKNVIKMSLPSHPPPTIKGHVRDISLDPIKTGVRWCQDASALVTLVRFTAKGTDVQYGIS